ncbi:MAG: preprotein translocase subunit SecG [Candidatus Kapabacteria bacterium]|jgi:protein translocase SecG subunit|nr:preprotein translocase subunit SecG [Candidatus Kapabacteria bacterium]
MDIVVALLTILISIALIGVVLLQPGKADMVAGMGGVGGTFTNILGVRQGRNILQNLTIGLAVALVAISIAKNVLFQADASATSGPTLSTENARIPEVRRPAQSTPQPQQGGQQGQPAPAPAPATP